MLGPLAAQGGRRLRSAAGAPMRSSQLSSRRRHRRESGAGRADGAPVSRPAPTRSMASPRLGRPDSGTDQPAGRSINSNCLPLRRPPLGAPPRPAAWHDPQRGPTNADNELQIVTLARPDPTRRASPLGSALRQTTIPRNNSYNNRPTRLLASGYLYFNPNNNIGSPHCCIDWARRETSGRR